MNSVNNYVEKEVSKIKKRVLKLLPSVNDVDIRIDKNEDGLYESMIKVHVPKKKELIATKKGSTIKRALDRSHNAISKQINKVKKIKTRREKSFFDYTDLSA